MLAAVIKVKRLPIDDLHDVAIGRGGQDGSHASCSFTGHYVKRELGASLVEYSLLLALIAVVAIGAITLVGRETKRDFDCVALELDHPGIRERIIHRIDVDDHWEVHLSIYDVRYTTACL